MHIGAINTPLEGMILTLAQQVTQPPPAGAQKSLLQYIQAGGTVGWLLIALSIAAVTLVIINFVRNRMSYWAPETIVGPLSDLLASRDVEGARKYCRDEASDCFVTRVVGRALDRCGRSAFGLLELREAIEEAGVSEADRMYRTTDGVALIAALGPMLGLFGTVIGLIGAFGSLADLEGAARSKELAGFMSLALVNTAQGLAVAIPSTAFYAIFKRQIDRLAADSGALVERITLPLLDTAMGERPAAPLARPAPPRPIARPEPAKAGE